MDLPSSLLDKMEFLVARKSFCAALENERLFSLFLLLKFCLTVLSEFFVNFISVYSYIGYAAAIYSAEWDYLWPLSDHKIIHNMHTLWRLEKIWRFSIEFHLQISLFIC